MDRGAGAVDRVHTGYQAMGQVVLHPRLEHSEKPEIFRQKIEELHGRKWSRIELFARKETLGWQAWGSEVSTGVVLNFKIG